MAAEIRRLEGNTYEDKVNKFRLKIGVMGILHISITIILSI